MSRGTKLQEMEQSKTAVNANATPGDTAMPSAGSNASGVTAGSTAQVEAVSYTHLTLPTKRIV